MRLSPQRHPLAILRFIAKITQKELADLVECSRATIQAIELGKLRLSEKLAHRITYQTGICPGWLLAGDVQRKAIRGDGTPFTKESFELERASLSHAAVRLGELEAIRLCLITAVERLASSAISAYKSDKIWLWTYKVEHLAALEEQFGADRAIRSTGIACYPEMKKQRPRIQPIIEQFGDRLMALAESKVACLQRRHRTNRIL